MGRAIALRLAREGARVAILDIDSRAGDETVRRVEALGRECVLHACDISRGDEVAAAVAATVARFGSLHVLVNNAGIMHPDDDLLENLEESAWDQTFAVNVQGPFHCCHFALPHIVASGGGAVVTIASMAAVMGTLRPAYGTSKAALVALTLCVARQFASRHVRANAILPGGVNTPMLETVMKYRASAAQPTYRPLQRFAEPDEIAAVTAFLASDESSHLTGSLFPVDGGATAV